MTLELLFHLTPKEIEVAELASQCFTVKQIAATMGISSARVRILISAIAFKAGCDAAKDERTQVALWWDRKKAVAFPHAV